MVVKKSKKMFIKTGDERGMKGNNKKRTMKNMKGGQKEPKIYEEGPPKTYGYEQSLHTTIGPGGQGYKIRSGPMYLPNTTTNPTAQKNTQKRQSQPQPQGIKWYENSEPSHNDKNGKLHYGSLKNPEFKKPVPVNSKSFEEYVKNSQAQYNIERKEEQIKNNAKRLKATHIKSRLEKELARSQTQNAITKLQQQYNLTSRINFLTRRKLKSTMNEETKKIQTLTNEISTLKKSENSETPKSHYDLALEFQKK